jgi:hypothetical protein
MSLANDNLVRINESLRNRIEILTRIANLNDSQLSHALEAAEHKYADLCSDYLDAGEPTPYETPEHLLMRQAVIQRLR